MASSFLYTPFQQWQTTGGPGRNAKASEGTSGGLGVGPSYLSNFTAGPILTYGDAVSSVAAAGVKMAMGGSSMSAGTAGFIQGMSSMLGRRVENVLPPSVPVQLKPILGFGLSNAALHALAGHRRGLPKKVAIGVIVDMASSAVAGEARLV